MQTIPTPGGFFFYSFTEPTCYFYPTTFTVCLKLYLHWKSCQTSLYIVHHASCLRELVIIVTGLESGDRFCWPRDMIWFVHCWVVLNLSNLNEPEMKGWSGEGETIRSLFKNPSDSLMPYLWRWKSAILMAWPSCFNPTNGPCFIAA